MLEFLRTRCQWIFGFGKTMIKNILEFCKKNAVYLIMGLTIVCLSIALALSLRTNSRLNGIIAYNDSTHTTTILSYDKDFKELKKENRQLYDSLKQYKNEIEYLIEFTYHKQYNSGKVVTNGDDKSIFANVNDEYVELSDSVYTYKQNTDTLSYNLEICSKTEPKWYSLTANLNEKFILSNRNIDGVNETTITTSSVSAISDITVYNKKEKRSVLDRFVVGPQIGVGYDVNNNKLGVQIGVGITYDLFRK